MTDTGIGVAPEKWNLLFRPFQQVDSSLARRHEGTGLGLALTKRLAELHGGTVSFQSQRDRGSKFRIWLPVVEPSPTQEKESPPTANVAPADPATEPSRDTDVKTILVVEDQPSNQILIAETLKIEGFAVESIDNGQAMLQRLQQPTARSLPDAVLMDIQLPEIDGFELIRHMKSHPDWQRVPVIALTALAMPGDRERCLDAGADAYLSKPLNLAEAIETIRTFVCPDS